MLEVNVFISYSAEDEGYARGLKRALEEAGIMVFSFLHTPLIPGSNFPSEVARHIYYAHFVALIWGTNSALSPWIHQEIAFSQQNNKIIIPILLNEQIVLPSSLADTQAILAYNDPAGWILQVRDAIFLTIQNFQAQQQMQQMEELQKKKKNKEMWKNVAGGLVVAGILGALFASDEDDNKDKQ